MRVNFDTQNYDKTANFKALKRVEGLKELEQLFDIEGFDAGRDIIRSLKYNDEFRKLCSKYDVRVNLKYMQPKSTEFRTDLSMEIFAAHLRKDRTLLDLFKKKYMPVASHLCFGIENFIEELSYRMIICYIMPKDGLKFDIDDFMKKHDRGANKPR